LIRVLENFALRNWQLRSIEGPLRPDLNVVQTFSVQEDIESDVIDGDMPL
jgi:hypothetical protein